MMYWRNIKSLLDIRWGSDYFKIKYFLVYDAAANVFTMCLKFRNATNINVRSLMNYVIDTIAGVENDRAVADISERKLLRP